LTEPIRSHDEPVARAFTRRARLVDLELSQLEYQHRILYERPVCVGLFGRRIPTGLTGGPNGDRRSLAVSARGPLPHAYRYDVRLRHSQMRLRFCRGGPRCRHRRRTEAATRCRVDSEPQGGGLRPGGWVPRRTLWVCVDIR